MVKGFKKVIYKDMLTRLGLTSLADRRLRGNFIETYEIVTGKEQVHVNNLFNLCQTGYNLRTEIHGSCNTQPSGGSTQFQRVVRPWN